MNDGKAVMTLVPDGLKRGRRHARVGRGASVERTKALDVLVVALRSKDCAFAHNVVDDNECANAAQFHGPIEIIGRTWLIRIDEDKIEWLGVVLMQCRHRFEGRTNPDRDLTPKSGILEILFGDLGMPRVELERCDVTALG